MLEERGVVVEVTEQGIVSVLTQRQSACGQCQNEKACSSQLLTSSSKSQQTTIVNANGLLLAKGDEVLLGVSEVMVWRGLLQLYIWPLVALTTGGIGGEKIANELGAIVGSFMCLALALWSVRWLTQRDSDNYLPIVIKKLF